ncbi:hsp70-binding protein 1 [Lycorma delicatula]|uniref:hsp70-binding protein 1 n=1 Tax=Lycorma delicatula TaxID=130591 RepID=UPI003F5118B2
MSADEKGDFISNNHQVQPIQNSLLPIQHNPNDALPSSSNPRRNPRNMQGLLKFLLETTKNEDGTHDSEFSPMDEERKEFLMNVFESMSVNIAEKLTESLKVISQAVNITQQDDPSDCENALEVLTDLVDEVDVANDFMKIGGLQACKPCLYSPHNGIRWRAAQLVGECAQNNPLFQHNAVQLTFLDDLIKLVDTDTDERVRVKALYAISTIMRGNEKAINFFHDIDACHTLMRALQSDSDRLKIKVAFLLSTAFSGDQFLKIQLQKMGFITLLVQLIMEALEGKKITSLEHLLGALISLSKDLPDALEDCRQPNLNFLNILDNIIQTYKDDSACLETVSYASSIKQMVYSYTDVINADR